MREHCKQNIVSSIRNILAMEHNKPYAQTCVLVLDKVTSPALSRLLSVEELLECGVSDLASAEKKKKPIPSAVSIYYISSVSLPKLYEDFAECDLYFSINLLLYQQASEDTMKEIGKQENIINRLASFGELHLPCRYLSSQLAYMQVNESQQKKQKMQEKEEQEPSRDNSAVQMTNRQLISTHVQAKHITLLPSVLQTEHKMASRHAKKLCETIFASFQIDPAVTKIKVMLFDLPFSKIVAQQLKKYIKKCLKEREEPAKDAQCCNELVIFVADRLLDMLSPLVRSYYYRPLLMDLFNITDKSPQIKIISTKISPKTISTDDPIWIKYKNMHVYQVFNKINDDFTYYIANNDVAKFSKEHPSNTTSFKDMKGIINEFPEYTNTIKGYEANIEILNVIGSIKKEEKLDELVELQHLIVSGYSGKREAQKDKKILEKVWKRLADIDIKAVDKTRILVLSACCLDISNEETSKVMKELSKIPYYGDVSMSLSKLCSRGMRKFPLSPSLHKAKQLFLDRHNCTYAHAIEEYLSNGKSKVMKQLIINQAIGGKQEPSSPSKISKLNPKTKPKVKHIVTMCGGLGYNEITNIERLFSSYSKAHQELEVNFICDTYLTPTEYIGELCALE